MQTKVLVSVTADQHVGPCPNGLCHFDLRHAQPKVLVLRAYELLQRCVAERRLLASSTNLGALLAALTGVCRMVSVKVVVDHRAVW